MSQFIHPANVRAAAELVAQAEVLVRSASDQLRLARKIMHDDVEMGADIAQVDGRRVIDFDRNTHTFLIKTCEALQYWPFDTQAMRHFHEQLPAEKKAVPA